MKQNRLLCTLFIIFALCVSCKGNEPAKIQPDGDGGQPPDTSHENHISDTALLDTVQHATFNYFWKGGEPSSGLALERTSVPTTVTTGGSGFFLASLPVAVKHGWITRDDAIQRLQAVLNFLERVPTYHGAFSHWYNGETAKTKPFGKYDNGGDLVETAFLMEGLLIDRQYFDKDNKAEKDIRKRITALWKAVDWTWYTQGENVLYWHWSPNYDFKIGLKITGYDEALIVYVLAASSPTHPIKPDVYHQGWAQGKNFRNGNKYYGVTLPLGPKKGGPLFFEHYSYIGLNPNGLKDQYANYEKQTKAHTLINYKYCVKNPLGYRGYGKNVWGLTASDDPDGYAAHSPTNDTGVITPTAAISSIPYTPKKSLRAMHYFYERLDDRLWGKYGFHDAFSLQDRWFDDDYLAIDEGPIVDMIENYRTGQLWKLFMSDPDVKKGLKKLGFTSPNI
jgi:hypothetical protein